jgi:hypothetical protein
MPKHQNRPTHAPGTDYLPDLALKMPLYYSQAHPEVLDTPSIALLRKHQSKSTAARLVDEVARPSHRKESAPSSITPKVHRPEHGLDLLGQSSTALNSAAWPDRSTSACASCSKRSLACVHAAALNALDEHDSDSHESHYAARVTQQQMVAYPQNGYADLEDTARRSQHHEGIDSPMMHRWLTQSPRQEGFNGIAAARTWSASVGRSRL